MEPINPHNQPGIYKRLTPADRSRANELAEYLAITFVPDWPAIDTSGIERKHDVIAVVKWISLVCKFATFIPIGSAVLRAAIYKFMDKVNSEAADFLKRAGA